MSERTRFLLLSCLLLLSLALLYVANTALNHSILIGR